jgi:hypothetical protein
MTVATGTRLFELPLTDEPARTETAKTKQRKEEAPGQCSARTGADDAAMRRFAAVYSDGGRLTLGQKLECVWEGLSAAGAAPCPLCGGRMLRHAEAARCTGCGSTLA